jgi:hypothetical protein
MNAKKHPADMKLSTLRNYWYGDNESIDTNFVFPIDITGYHDRDGLLRWKERFEEVRENARRIGLIP